MVTPNLHIKLKLQLILTLFLMFFLCLSSVYAQNKVVKAKKGDGVYTLMTRHHVSYYKYKDEFYRLNKKRLGKNNTLIAGRKYYLPSSSSGSSKKVDNQKTIALLGKDYANVKVKDNQLKGAIYYLVAGHGGPDPGAMGHYANKLLCEDEYAYDVTLRLAKNLMEHGAKVHMIIADPNDGIRDGKFLAVDHDEYCYPKKEIPLNQIKRLKQRTNAVNKLYLKNRKAFQRAVIIHIDSRSKRKNIDVFFYHDKRSKTGKKAANILLNTFEEQYRKHQPNRGYRGSVSKRNLYVVRKTYPTAIFIELGNINHRRDQKRFIIADNRQAVANWLTLGLLKDYKTNK